MIRKIENHNLKKKNHWYFHNLAILKQEWQGMRAFDSLIKLILCQTYIDFIVSNYWGK